MNKSDLIAMRGFLPDDQNLILATWLRGLYYSDTWYSEIPKSVFMKEYHEVLLKLLASPNTEIKIACLKEDPYVVLGYAVYSSPHSALHWVYIKKNWRGIGLAKDLTPSSINTATHTTKVGLSVMKKKGISFNPFLINKEE